MSIDFSDKESQRYSRNVLLAEVGWSGQERFRAGRVIVVGAGGIGSASLFYLAAAGVGHIGLVDGDAVELSNLQRQILHRVDDLDRRKVESARDAIAALNPHCRVETYDVRLDAVNIREILRGHEVVLDASDNFQTRFWVADACWLEKIPLVSAAVNEFTGQLLIVDPGQGSPCYRCLMPGPAAEEPPERLGILGGVAGVMGCLQAVEALKLLLGRTSDMAHQLLSYDALKTRFSLIARSRAPNCPQCGEKSKVPGQ